MTYQEISESIKSNLEQIQKLESANEQLYLQRNKLKFDEITQQNNIQSLFEECLRQKFVIQKSTNRVIPIDLKVKSFEVAQFPTLFNLHFEDDYFRIGFDNSESSWSDTEFEDDVREICKYVSNQLFKKTNFIYYSIPETARYSKLRTKKYNNYFTKLVQIHLDVTNIK